RGSKPHAKRRLIWPKPFLRARFTASPRHPILTYMNSTRPQGATTTRRRAEMAILIGDTAPDFTAQTTEGEIRFHDYIDGHWAVLFSHPKNYTPVCTTELGYTAKLKPEFEKRGVKVLGLSVDKIE